MTNFEICQLLATPGPFEYSGQNNRCSENQFILNEGVTRLWWGLGVLGGQVPRPYGGTIFGGCDTLGVSSRALNTKVPFFLTHLQQLRGYSALTDLVKNQSTGVDWGTLHTLVWIFEYVTDWPFPGALSADFLRISTFQKSPEILEQCILGILTHKFAWRCQSIWLGLVKIKKNSMLTAVWVMTAWVSGPFWAKTQIICLLHEGSTTWVQCQLGFVGDPCSYQKTSFKKFCN